MLLKYYKIGFFYRTLYAWNKLDFDTRNTFDKNLFKKHTKKHLWGEVLTENDIVNS